MESSFLFFLVGFSIYFVKRFLGEKRPGLQHVLFVVTGFLSAGIITTLAGVPWPHTYALPWILLLSVTGGLGGLLIYLAERTRFIYRPGIRNFATLFLGLLLSGLSYLLTWLFSMLTGYELQISQTHFLIPVSFIFIGFLIIFGYTFPSRWIKKKS